MATRLSLYNGALRWCKATRLASTADNRKERRELDDVYDDVTQYMVEQGLWHHAGTHVKLQSPTTGVVGYGYTYAYAVPADYVRIMEISASETMRPTLADFEEYKTSTATTDIYIRAWAGSPLYLKYVSNSTSFGTDPARYPPTYTKAFELELAVRVGLNVSAMKLDEHNKLIKLASNVLIQAQSKDAVNSPAVSLPRGRLVTARGAGRSGVNAMRKEGYPGG